MDKIKALREGIQSLITEKSSVEEAERIGKLSAQIDSIEQEQNALIESKEELRKKYVESVKNASFGGIPNSEVDDTPKKAKTFEECLAEAQQK